MKTEITSNLYCVIYGHNYFNLKKTSSDTPDLVCKCCKKYFSFNEEGNIIEVNKKQNSFIPLRVKKEK